MFCFNQLFSTIKEECKFSGKIFFADLMYFEKSTTIIWVFGLYIVSALSSYAGSLVKDRAKRERANKERAGERKEGRAPTLNRHPRPPPSFEPRPDPSSWLRCILPSDQHDIYP